MTGIRYKDLITTTKFISIVIMIVAIGLYYHPAFVDLSKEENLRSGSILSPLINIIFIFIFILSFSLKRFVKYNLIKNYTILNLIFILLLLIPVGVGYDINFFNTIKLVSIPTMGMIIGRELKYTIPQLRIMATVFVLVITFVALMQIRTNIGGFVILENYATDHKNALGVLVGTASLVSLLLSLGNHGKFIMKIYYIISYILLIAIILTIRARAALLFTGMISAYILYMNFKSKIKLFHVVLITSVIILTLSLEYFDGPITYIEQSIILNQEGDITNKRMERNVVAINYLFQNPWFGNIVINAPKFGLIHNFVILQLFNYGIVFSIFILLGYFKILINVLSSIFQIELNNINYIGIPILLLPYGISLLEPSLPYGPGTATVFNYIMYGIAQKYKFE